MKMLLDRSLLLIVGLICAIGAWFFWSSLGEDAFEVFGAIFLIYLALENHMLRKYIKRNDSQNDKVKE